jgi:hypothetical protein
MIYLCFTKRLLNGHEMIFLTFDNKINIFIKSENLVFGKPVLSKLFFISAGRE